VVPAAALSSVSLVAVELGWVPGARRAWGFTLWQYLPRPFAIGLAATLLALCLPTFRRMVVAALGPHVRRLVGQPGTPARWALLLVGTIVGLWLLRERQFHGGDALILLFNAASRSQFLFPDVGATYLFYVCSRIASALAVSGVAVLQAAVVLFGGVAVLCTVQVARYLAPGPGRAVLCLALVLGGGLTRVLAGHVEVYAFVLLCAAAYVWSALAFLRGRTGPALPALALGTGLWMHLSFSFLVPSLLALFWLEPARPDRRALARRMALGLALVPLPTLAFLAIMLGIGRTADIAQAWRTLLEWGTFVPSPVDHEAFLRGFFASSGPGTRYVIFSPGHLVYLVNVFFLMVPVTGPILVAFAVLSPRRYGATREAVFLSVAGLFLALYSSVVRPVWGPYDWELFSLTAFCLACLAAHLLVHALDDPPLAELGVVLVAAMLLTVTVPLLAIGIEVTHDAGPFAYGALRTERGESLMQTFERRLGPWL